MEHAVIQDEAAEKIVELFKGPMAFYNSDRQNDEIDLVKEVRQRFLSLGLEDKLQDGFDSNRFILEADGKNSHVQQFLLNRYLSIQFMASESDTAVERYALMNEVNPSEWLTVFEQRILPAVVNLDLPVKI